MNTFRDTYDEKVRPLMDKIDSVRIALSGNLGGIIFPTVVVVGDQSSGKSTLLEALSSIELPKGSGIVTRCPLVLRLRKSTESRVYHLHGADKRTELDPGKLDIPTYIENETIRLAGNEKRIVMHMIELEVHGPSFRDLTVVDLPGIARTPIADQPKDIYSQTTSLIRRFIKEEGTIILCVFPANVDVGTVESFNLAKEVDPEGVRTIGVITKSDLSPKEDQLCQQLLMEKPEVVHLKLGFIAVRNRAHNETFSIQEAREKEREFFQNHLASSQVGWDLLGVDSLSSRLADLYSDRVKKMFPRICDQVQMKLEASSELLSKLPDELDQSERLAKFHELADSYLDNFIRAKVKTTNEHRIGLIDVLHGNLLKYEKILDQQTKSLQTPEYGKKIARVMESAVGEQLKNFSPHYIIKYMVNEKIGELWETTQHLINDCFTAIRKLLLTNWEIGQPEDVLMAKLLPEFHGIVNSHLKKQKTIVHDALYEMIRLEKNDPFTINKSYMHYLDLCKKNLNCSGLPMTGIEEMICSIPAYWEVLRNRFMDYVGLTLRAAFVFDVYNGVRERLRRVSCEQRDFVDRHLGDDIQTREQRKKLQQTCDRLQKAVDILGGRQMADPSLANGFGKADDSELDKLGKR